VLFKLGMVNEALRELQQAVLQDPNSAQAHFQLGLAWFANGAQQEARTEFERAITLAPDLAEARINLGQLQENENRMAEAISQYREALRASPASADAALRLSRALIKTQALHDARIALDGAIGKHPRDPALRFELGRLMAMQGDREGALRELKTAIQFNPKVSEY